MWCYNIIFEYYPRNKQTKKGGGGISLPVVITCKIFREQTILLKSLFKVP